MQQYIVIAYDGTDADALERRMAVRPLHFEKARQMKITGNFIKGGAFLDPAGKMIGSVMMMAFATKEDLDQWLATEPYVTGKVWQRIDVQPFRVADV